MPNMQGTMKDAGSADISVEALPPVTALVATYNRVFHLERCINGLRSQWYLPREIIVVVRDEDRATWDFLERLPQGGIPIRPVAIGVGGQVHAINKGLAEVTSEVVAITDDDAVPHADWTLRMARAFAADRRLGGVGGRDIVHHGDRIEAGSEPRVGKLPKIGRMIGNHHIGVGPPRYVDVLKGVNGAYRCAAIRSLSLDTRLRGTGAQVHWEVGFGMRLRAAGWALWYDPNILVDHYVAQRFDEDQRDSFNELALRNASYNEALLRMEPLTSLERAAYLAWVITIGTRATPGLVQVLRFAPSRLRQTAAMAIANIGGVLDAWRYLRRTR